MVKGNDGRVAVVLLIMWRIRLHVTAAGDKIAGTEVVNSVEFVIIKLPAPADEGSFIGRGGNHFAKQRIVLLLCRGGG